MVIEVNNGDRGEDKITHYSITRLASTGSFDGLTVHNGNLDNQRSLIHNIVSLCNKFTFRTADITEKLLNNPRDYLGREVPSLQIPFGSNNLTHANQIRT